MAGSGAAKPFLARHAAVGSHTAPSALNLAALSFALALHGAEKRQSPHLTPRASYLVGMVTGTRCAATVGPQLCYSWQLWRGRVAALLAVGYYACPVLVIAPPALRVIANALA
jgi:hypothetical protein